MNKWMKRNATRKALTEAELKHFDSLSQEEQEALMDAPIEDTKLLLNSTQFAIWNYMSALPEDRAAVIADVYAWQQEESDKKVAAQKEKDKAKRMREDPHLRKLNRRARYLKEKQARGETMPVTITFTQTDEMRDDRLRSRKRTAERYPSKMDLVVTPEGEVLDAVDGTEWNEPIVLQKVISELTKGNKDANERAIKIIQRQQTKPDDDDDGEPPATPPSSPPPTAPVTPPGSLTGNPPPTGTPPAASGGSTLDAFNAGAGQATPPAAAKPAVEFGSRYVNGIWTTTTQEEWLNEPFEVDGYIVGYKAGHEGENGEYQYAVSVEEKRKNVSDEAKVVWEGVIELDNVERRVVSEWFDGNSQKRRYENDHNEIEKQTNEEIVKELRKMGVLKQKEDKPKGKVKNNPDNNTMALVGKGQDNKDNTQVSVDNQNYSVDKHGNVYKDGKKVTAREVKVKARAEAKTIYDSRELGDEVEVEVEGSKYKVDTKTGVISHPNGKPLSEIMTKAEFEAKANSIANAVSRDSLRNKKQDISNKVRVANRKALDNDSGFIPEAVNEVEAGHGDIVRVKTKNGGVQPYMVIKVDGMDNPFLIDDLGHIYEASGKLKKSGKMGINVDSKEEVNETEGRRIDRVYVAKELRKISVKTEKDKEFIEVTAGELERRDRELKAKSKIEYSHSNQIAGEPKEVELYGGIKVRLDGDRVKRGNITFSNRLGYLSGLRWNVLGLEGEKVHVLIGGDGSDHVRVLSRVVDGKREYGILVGNPSITTYPNMVFDDMIEEVAEEVVDKKGESVIKMKLIYTDPKGRKKEYKNLEDAQNHFNEDFEKATQRRNIVKEFWDPSGQGFLNNDVFTERFEKTIARNTIDRSASKLIQFLGAKGLVETIAEGKLVAPAALPHKPQGVYAEASKHSKAENQFESACLSWRH